MFDHYHYIPILKWKRGERIALKNLSQEQMESITPLFEIQPIPYDHKLKTFKKTIDKHLENTGDNLSDIWLSNRPVFVDGHTLFDDQRIDTDITLNNGQTPLEFFIDDIEAKGIPAVPVTSILRYESYHEAVQSCIDKYTRGVCLRLERSDFHDIKKLKLSIDQFLENTGVSVEEVDIIIDFKQINPDEKDSVMDELILIIAKFPYLNQWRTFSFASTSMTSSLSHIPTNTTHEIERIEWDIYSELLNQGIKRLPTFSDYNVSHPDWFDFDPTKYDRGANIKYTVNDKYIIFRGRGVRKHGLGQMQQLCHNAVNHDEFCSKTFSFGDDYIYNCALGQASTGTSETWVRVNANHHLAFVINCLTNARAGVTA